VREDINKTMKNMNNPCLSYIQKFNNVKKPESVVRYKKRH